MPRKITRELLDGFLIEVQDSLLTVGDLLQSLDQGEWDPSALEEAHRLAHSVKGAALMVRFPAVELIARLLEEVLEEGLTNEEASHENLLATSFALWNSLSAYLEGLHQKSLKEETLLSDAVGAYCNHFPELGEEQMAHLQDSLDAAINSESLQRLLEERAGKSAKPKTSKTAKKEASPEPEASAEETGLDEDIDPAIIEGIDRDLKDRDNVPPELLEVFNEEADDHLTSLYRSLEEIEKDHASRELVQELRRAAHTLKGAAGAVGLRTITQIAHRMEDLLDRLYDEEIQPSPAQIKLIYQTTDTLQDLAKGTFDREKIRHSVAGLYVQYDQQLQANEENEPAADVAEKPAVITPARKIDISPNRKRGDVSSHALRAGEEHSHQGNKPAGEPPRTAAAPPAETVHQGPALRVPLERIDEVSRLVGEMIINRSSLEQRMNVFHNFVEELEISLERLRKIAQELETHYEVEALGGRWDRGKTGTDFGKLSKADRWKPIRPAAPSLRVSKNRLEEFDELEFDRYTEFHLLARSLSEVTNDVGTVGNELNNLTGEFDALLTRQSRLAREAQDRLTRVRMVPLATIADRVKRTVRTVADQTGKNIQLTLEGEHVELDKNAIEELVEPLMHLLRNAADHGIESPEERAELGKTEEANISIRAFPQGTQVILEIADDGRGIDAAKIRAKAVELGMLAAEDAESLDEETCRQLLFEPGFSTANELTEVSGRGVGMDIVREKIRKLKGTISMASTVGQGTAFTIRLPMTQAVTRALLVRVEKQIFAVPMQSVVQILRVDPHAVERIAGESVIQVAGETHPLHRMANRLGIPSAAEWGATELSTMLPVVILGTGKSKVGFQIDGIIGARDIVVKTLGTHLVSVKGLLGATLLGDGTVVPILDPIRLVGEKQEDVSATAHLRPARTADRPSQNRPLTVFVADDSVSVRRVTTNLIKSVGWIPIDAKDGRDALEVLHGLTGPPDVFLLDIEMPRMDGYELLGFLRSQPAYRHTPVIMVTSRAGEKHRSKALDLGATGYMVKPYQDDALLSLIRELVQQPKPGSPARLLV